MLRGGRRQAGRSRLRTTRGLAAAVVALSLVGGGGAGVAPAAAAQPVDPVPGDDWAVEAPEAHGIDPDVLAGARDYAFADGMNTQGVVVVHDGAIVAEWYADGAGPDSWAASWSMAKSVASATVGIAIDEGLIPSVDEPMTTYFPEWAGTDKAGITLRHVLRMESGLDWDESYDPADVGESEVIEMVVIQQDQLAYAASRPAEVPPGTRWSYSSGDSMLLSRVIEQATGMPADEYAREKLFEPLGIDQIDWWRDAAGHTLTYCCVDTTSRDFARFGLLYLRDGAWGDDQVVPASWVADSLAGSAASGGGYGYQWWLDGGDQGDGLSYFSARGHDGQYIYVVPELDLVVVRNGTYGKSPCEPVADPNLFVRYPSGGLVPGEGTTPPEQGWDDLAFLQPIVDSFTGEGAGAAAYTGAPAEATPTAAVTPAAAATPAPVVSPTQAACDTAVPPAGPAGPPASPASGPPQARPAVPVPGSPAYTG